MKKKRSGEGMSTKLPEPKTLRGEIHYHITHCSGPSLARTTAKLICGDVPREAFISVNFAYLCLAPANERLMRL